MDVEEWAYWNALENVAVNNVSHIKVLHGDVYLVENKKFDVVLANINRSVLLQDIPHYRKILHRNGLLIMSGFYKEDIPIIREKCETCGLTFQYFRERDNWVVLVFELD